MRKKRDIGEVWESLVSISDEAVRKLDLNESFPEHGAVRSELFS